MNANKIIPDWKLERFILDELPQSEINSIKEQEQFDPRLRERIESLRENSAELLEKYPLKRMISGSKKAPLHKPKSSFFLLNNWKSIPVWAAPAFACAAVVLILPLYMLSSITSKAETIEFEEERIKGLEPRLEVWRKTGETAEKLDFKAGVNQGDVIQLRYLVPQTCYGTIVSLDGRGAVTVHLSGETGKAAPLTPGRAVALDHSYQLDDAPEFEIFYLITSSQNFDINEVTQSIQKVKNPDDLPALPHITLSSFFVITKAHDLSLQSASKT
jgi:hypothetical protein